MIGYVTLGTNDREKSARFYDALCAELGVGRMMENEQFIAWGKPGGGAGIGLTRPFDGNAASVGNGVMVALEASDHAQCRRLSRTARPQQRDELTRFYRKVDTVDGDDVAVTPYQSFDLNTAHGTSSID